MQMSTNKAQLRSRTTILLPKHTENRGSNGRSEFFTGITKRLTIGMTNFDSKLLRLTSPLVPQA